MQGLGVEEGGKGEGGGRRRGINCNEEAIDEEARGYMAKGEKR